MLSFRAGMTAEEYQKGPERNSIKDGQPLWPRVPPLSFVFPKLSGSNFQKKSNSV